MYINIYTEVVEITKLLIKLFVKNYNDSNSKTAHTSYGKLAGAVGIAVNLMLSSTKFFIGILTNSIAITADAVNNIFDVTAGIVTLIGFKMASRPADKEHPYGHARIEYITGLIIALMIFLVGFELVQTSIDKIINPTDILHSAYTVSVLIISILAKIWLAFFNKNIANIISSETLKATAADCRNDAISTSAVLVSVVISQYWGVNLDGIMGLLVAVFIIYSAVGIVKDVTDPLLGKAPSRELVQHIENKILKHKMILGTHDLIIHDYGQNRCFGSAHVEIDAKTDPIESHHLIDEIERDFFENDNIIFVIHYDPVLVGDVIVEKYKAKMQEKIARISTKLSLHDFRVVDNKNYVNLIFDVEAPFEFELTDEELKDKIQKSVENSEMKINTMVTVDRRVY